MNKFAKSILSVSAAAVVATVTLVPATGFANAYGDNSGLPGYRPVYTLDEINAGKLGETITFNSISKGSKLEDERNFVGARLTTGNASYYNGNDIKVEDDQIYTIRLYVHNNSPKNTAKGVTVRFNVPTAVSTTHDIFGYINAENANPTNYYDDVELKSDDDTYVEYIMGSAKYRNEKGTFALSDDIITKNGVKIGYETMNGEIPGCFQYSGEVTIQVKVHKSVNAKLSKTVRIKGSGEKFAETVEAKIGDEVEFQIEYVNLLADQVKDVMIRDFLPNNLEYVKDSTYLYNSNHKEGILLSDNNLTTTGINIGSYKSRGNAYVRFTAKVVDKSMACGGNQLVNWANSTVASKVAKDNAIVLVKKTGDICNEPTPTPTPTPTPSNIVETGASNVLIGALGAGGLTTLVGYTVISRRKF